MRRRLAPSSLVSAVVLVAAAAGATSAVAQNGGISAPANLLGEDSWQARFERDGTALAPLRAVGLLRPLTLQPSDHQSLRLLGDYSPGWLRLGDSGGVRLTGGVLLSVRQPQAYGSGVEQGALPVAGVGYAGVGYAYGVARTAHSPEWGFSADVGLTGLSFGNPQLGRQTLNVDGNGLGPRGLQPTLRLGMSLSF